MAEIASNSVVELVLSYDIVNSKRVYDEYTHLVPTCIYGSGKTKLMSKLCLKKVRGKSHTFRIRLKLKKIKTDVTEIDVSYLLRGTTAPSEVTIANACVSVIVDGCEVASQQISSQLFELYRMDIARFIRSENGWELRLAVRPLF